MMILMEFWILSSLLMKVLKFGWPKTRLIDAVLVRCIVSVHKIPPV